MSLPSKLRRRLVWAALGLAFHPGCYLTEEAQRVECKEPASGSVCPTEKEEAKNFLNEYKECGGFVESVQEGPLEQKSGTPPGCCYLVTGLEEAQWFPGTCGRPLLASGHQRISAVVPSEAWA